MNERRSYLLDCIAVVASIIAVGISVWAMRLQKQLGHEISTQTLIHDQYELCRVLDQMRVERPEISHMLALPAQSGTQTWHNYFQFKKHIRTMFSDEDSKSPKERSKIYLQEHAVALHVFDIYEQTLYQRSLAQNAKDKGRFEVLDMLTKYYEGRLLRNPRLRYHWDQGGVDMMETDTRTRYETEVKKAFPDDPVDIKSPLDE